MRELLEKFKQAIIAGDFDASVALAEDIRATADASADDIFASLSAAMDIVGGKYETGEYFIPEMLRSAEAAEKAMAILEPYLYDHKRRQAGVIVMGTVKGDIHNIGKNIIVSALKADGYEVHDLGVNVAADKFIAKVREVDADLLMLSAFTTSTKPALLDIISRLKDEGLRDKVKIVSGGAAHSAELADAVGVDGFASDVKSTLEVTRRLMGR